MSPAHSETALREAVNDGVVRVLAVVGLIGVALIHLLDLPGKLSETPYMFWMYLALMVSCVVLAGALVRTSDSRAWLAAAFVPATVILGYVLSRTTGLPSAHGDVGNWTEPLGLASLFVEGSVVAVAGAAFLATRHSPRTQPVRAERAEQRSARPITRQSMQAS